jgi:hypothetical protein
MYQGLNGMIKRTLKLTILLIIVMAIAGCATVSSDELIPKSFTFQYQE